MFVKDLNTELDFTEFFTLAAMLSKVGAQFEVVRAFDGYQLLLPGKKDDVICHGYSNGANFGLLETYRLNDCAGFETAKDVFEGWLANGYLS